MTEAMDTQSSPHPWHALPAEEVVERLASSGEGLSDEEAKARLSRFGPNELRETTKRGPLRRFFDQLRHPLIYVLAAAALVTLGIGEHVDAAVIFAVVLIIAVIGFIQEGKAEEALEAIRSMLSPEAAVLRGGHRKSVAAAELVPGDVVFLESGDKVPADVRLSKVRNFQVQEAALTGESLAVDKRVDPVEDDADLGDRTSLAFSGTVVTSGQARGVVVATGQTTQLGRISAMVSEVETTTTPLTQQMNRFSRWLTVVILAVAGATFAFAVLARAYGTSDAFLAAVSLAVAAIPEGLPAIMTITLAIGVTRMARRHAIIRRLPSVETIGAVTVICSDKTGTLTRNELTAQRVLAPDRAFGVEGIGYDPHASILREGHIVQADEDPQLAELARCAVLCGDARLGREPAGTESAAAASFHVDGDPTDGAALVFGMRAGVDPEHLAKERPRTDEIPFDSGHKYMATLHHDHEGHGHLYVKGAPERVLAMCESEWTPAGPRPLDADAWHERVHQLASDGMRVIAAARRDVSPETRSLRSDDVEGGDLSLLGLFGLIDPPREEAIAAVADCKRAGIRVVMITGDHAITARAVAEQLGLDARAGALTGRELEELDDAGLREAVRDVNVFARTTPEHKLRLVRALQENGEVVAMTGDGVNDAPALKRADVGIAMGDRGTEAAKEAAEQVLADDNFASIVHAVEEGRTVYDNLKKTILFLLPTNGGQMLIILLAILLGIVLPITPLQILWVNMVTAVTLGLALAFEAPEPDVMRRAPRPPRASMLSGFLLWRIAFVSVLLVAGSLGKFAFALEVQNAELPVARTLAVNTLIVAQTFYLFSARFVVERSASIAGIFGSRHVWIAIAVVAGLQAAFTYLPVMNRLFDTAPIGPVEWLLLLGVGLLVFVLVELEKAITRRGNARRRRRGTAPPSGERGAHAETSVGRAPSPSR